MATGFNRLWVAAVLLLTGTAFAQEVNERDAAELRIKRDSAVDPATGRLTAWFEVRHLPLWRNRNGNSPRWVEMGPTVLKNGWGGMDNSGRATSAVVDPTDRRILWVGAASGGIWRSDDEGRTWRPTSDDTASLSIGSIAVDPFDHNTIYAGTGEPHGSIDSFHGAGLLRSKDGGKSWDLLSSEVFLGTQFSRVVPHTKRPGFLYAASTRGVLRSTDGGATWVQLLRGNATDLVIDSQNPSSIIALISAGGRARGLFRSTDSGQTWRQLTNGLPVNSPNYSRSQMSNCEAYPNVVYASLFAANGALAGMYKTTDFGDSWIRLPNAPDYGGGQGWYDNYVTASKTNPNVVFCGGTSTYRTVDGGNTWIDDTRSYAGGPVHPDHHYLTFSPHDPNTVYLCTDGGVFRSRDLGDTWEAVNHGLNTIQFQSLDVHPTDANVAWGGTQDNGTNKYTGSMEWLNVFLGDGGVTRVNPRNPEIVYTEYVGLVIMKSTNGGLDWRWNVTEGIDPKEGKLFYAPYNLDPSNPDILVAGAEKVYRSTDAAEHWTAISPKLGARVSAVTVAPNIGSVIYAGTSDGKVWVTPNTGKDWYNVSAGLPGAAVTDICIDPRNARTVYVALNGWSPNRIWKSTDAGGHWTSVMDDLPPMPIQSVLLHPLNPERVYIATNIGVFVSDDGGGRWKRFGAGLPNVPVYSLVANLKTGWITAGTHGRGAWRIPLGD